MATLISHSPAETLALGESWGQTADSGWVFALCGDLGAGKTQLVKGLARGLGSPDPVRSPTFALLNIYGGGRLPLFHLDLYRLETGQQIQAAGLEEYFTPAGVAVIEWAERWPPFAALTCVTDEPSSARSARSWVRRVRLEVLGELKRRIDYEDFGR
jgi:tRNA threonylcarbamoyladenosine biosynthesis protein TsaE